jgi:hypothetical protein
VTTSTLNEIALRAVTAYGGAERWRSAETVQATFDCGGLLVRWKRRGANYKDIRVTASVHEPRVRMERFDADGTVALLDGHDVRLERADGTTILQRPSARQNFPYGSRLLKWDQADFAYFIGYAIWNYLTFPALLIDERIDWRPLENGLESRFPPELPTHNKVQQFYFDPATGLLEEYDYVAEVYGGWAKAAHMIEGHTVNEDGITYANTRRVKPRKPPAKGRGALSGPIMMFADIRDYKLS